MRYILLFVLLFAFGMASAQYVPFGAARIQDTSRTLGSIQAQGAMILPLYATPDTNKVFGVDSRGRVTLRTKVSEAGTVTNVSTGFGMLGGPINTAGTVRVDSFVIATRLRLQKVADSLAALNSGGTVTSIQVAAGTGLSVSLVTPVTTTGIYTLTNTAPDQTVVLNNGSGISVTGTYPTFTVTNTSPSSGGTVTSVTGTSNRVTSTGGTTPVIDISSSYVGQTSINTLGTVSAATWQATPISTTYTDAKVVSVTGTSGNITSTGGGTPILNLATAGTAGTYGSAAAIPVVTTDAFGRVTTVTTVAPVVYVSSVSGTTNQIDVATGTTTPVISLHSGGTLPGAWALGTPASMVGTNITGTASGLTVGTASTAPASGLTGTTLASNVVTTSATSVGAITTGTWTATVVSPQYGGTGLSSITTGNIILGAGTSTATLLAPSTSGKIPISNGTTFVMTTPTFPNASATSGKVIKSDGTNWIASTETYATPSTSGNVLTSDGTNWTSAAPVVTPSNTVTFTNKAWQPRTFTTTNVTTSVTINADLYDIYEITAQAGALLFNAPSGTPVYGQILEIDITDNNTARALTYNAAFGAWGQPTTTVLGKPMIMIFQWSVTEGAWRYVGGKTKP